LEKNKINYGSIKKFAKYYYDVQEQTIFINEPGLFELILSSHKEQATDFKNWIISDVLPLMTSYLKLKY